MTATQTAPILILTTAVITYAVVCAWALLDVFRRHYDPRCVVARLLMLKLVRELAENLLLPSDSGSNAGWASAWAKTAFDTAVGLLFIIHVFLPRAHPRNDANN